VNKPSKQVSEEAQEVIHSLIADVDKCIIDSIRQERDNPARRDTLLNELDVLEKVRERLNVRCDG